ncbi:hypothetical protein EXN66_Car005636 [Channa argus]|uniref:Uncharacterized protein n=1 Tax=Channa argus TaxID=215402 RepID=A0A6G1PIK4_CHAAH|nr:hypothetical protein EXN66_Car005636 [Channa argus]
MNAGSIRGSAEHTFTLKGKSKQVWSLVCAHLSLELFGVHGDTKISVLFHWIHKKENVDECCVSSFLLF